MTIQIITNNIELQCIVYPRLPPYIWDIIGYSGGLVVAFYYDRIGIIVYACSFILYGLLNVFFDICVVSFEYSNNAMPNYKSIGNYNFYITNKKYILQNINKSKPFDAINMVDDSKLKLELSIYVGENCIVKYCLFFIYLCGITKRNYTINDYNDYKDTICYFC
jgi:hypothetical protein